ncbi:4963_t:CDS:10 [Paraglomus occultum]|uniref:eIF-2-alpha kinase activator GCN1 n=1 Tax=Paraglomus occultum TaxID=144539 RepID=A0A9N8W893_9GLOM|nr:4963_t:CDS:10 [Paraglomus occultum]
MATKDILEINVFDLALSDLFKNRGSAIYSSDLNTRLEFLNALLTKIRAGGYSEKILPRILQSLLRTYTRYDDRASRQAVLTIFSELYEQKAEAFLKAFVPLIVDEAQELNKKSSDGSYTTSANNRFVLLTWINALIVFAAQSDDSIKTKLIELQAILLDSLIDDKIRRTIRRGAIVDVRRCVRKIPLMIPLYITHLTSTTKSTTPSYRNSILLGTIIDVAIRLKTHDGKKYVQDQKDNIIQYYLTAVAGSKTIVNRNATEAFNDFIATMISEGEFGEKFVPSLQKLLLRAPEIVLNVLNPLVNSLSFDTSELFKAHFLQQLLTLVRSSNKTVQANAVALLCAFTEKSRKDEVVVEIGADVMKLLSGARVSSPDHRLALYTVLSFLHRTPLTVPSLISGLIPLLSKEINENSLSKGIQAFSSYVPILLSTETEQELFGRIITAITSGISSAKLPVRRSWALGLGNIVWDAREDASVKLRTLVRKGLELLIGITEKIAANPLAAGGAVEAYVCIAIIERVKKWKDEEIDGLIESKNLRNIILVTSPKPSFLLWDKVYSKFTTFEEGRWFLRALEGILLNERVDAKEVKIALAVAFIYLITAANDHETRREAYDTLVRCNKENAPLVGEILQEGLRNWVGNLEKGSRDSTAMLVATSSPSLDPTTSAYRLSTVLTAITTFEKDVDSLIAEHAVVNLLVLAHHPAIVSPTDKYNWISLVQRAGLNPGKIVETHYGKLRQLVLDNINVGYESQYFYKAAMHSISTLVFIHPEVIVPLFMAQCHRDLDVALLNGIGDHEIGIWKTKENELFVDVLKRNKNKIVEDRNRKDYQTERWEREVREQIAKKKGASNTDTPKLTKDEQAAVDAQFAKESQIRKHVNEIREKMLRGLDIIDSMIRGNSGAMGERISELMQLLNVVVKKGGKLFGQKAVETYLKIGECTDDSVKSVILYVGIATLRVMDIQEVPEQWQEEPLGHLCTRVLFRLRLITERTPLSPTSFTYCFALIYEIIQKKGIEYVEASYDHESEYAGGVALEQVALSLDIIKFHCSRGASSLLPRESMLESLLLIIKEVPKLSKKARNTLMEFCQAISETATVTEISVLFRGLLVSESFLRHACLQALEFLDLTEFDFATELWIACFDEDTSCSRLATKLWDDNGMDIEDCYAVELLSFVVHEVENVRIAAAKALGNAVIYYQNTVSDTLQLIFQRFKEEARPIQPEYDEYGMIIQSSLNKKDPWESRYGLAYALEMLAPKLEKENFESLLNFLIVNEAVGDRNDRVREKMLDVGLALIDAHGTRHLSTLMPIFEQYLDQPPIDSEVHDRIRESVVIWFGALAKNLNSEDPRIPIVIDRLLDTLKTPSEPVQQAVAQCLPPLMKTSKEVAPALIKQLMNELFHSEKYAHRRGAAYGLAGVVKGAGLAALKDCRIMAQLNEAVDNKKDYKCRQGALFAFETLSLSLGRLFEPYVIQILPLLLACYGDSNPDVREATAETSRAIMSKISGHCVKLILPSLLEGLKDTQWRTKKGSVELLGAMAFCAPKQLSISLPTIVPRLTEVLTDSHTHVQSAANQALLHFGEIINNPEIQALVPVLLQALSDPDKNTQAALDNLLETAFVHYIDAPSLALVMPILERGLRERGTEIKKKASQIVGNMAFLTDVNDLIPYLSRLLPGLNEVLVDPVPEARATAAKALGSMVEKLGEDNFPGLIDDLINTLRSDTSGVDRQGAAQGLSEILAGLGLEKLDGLLPEIITNTGSKKHYVREGFMSLLIYLPATFGTRFQPYLGRTIPAILSGLADDSEYVRDASLRAGQMIVTNYANKAVDLLLPELERGLFDDNWRIRQSSVQLMGDLLYRITGISGKSNIGEDEDEAGGTEASRKALLETLGRERRDRVLAALYIVRQDVAALVRSSALHVWKAIVSNTPRTIKEMLPIMMTIIIRNLASTSIDQRQVAARTLGELVRKLGESVLSEIVPILEKGLDSSESGTRQGVCIALSEIMGTAGKLQIIDFMDSIISAVRKALVDESAEVREAAAQAFDALQQHVGPKAIDEILPSLLNSLQSEENSTYALEALKEIMTVRANIVFPVLIPTLITVPITTFNARALASLVTVAGPVLNRRLTNILSALMNSIIMETNQATIQELRETEKALLLSIDNAEGLQTLMMMLFETVKSEQPSQRAATCDVIAIFCSESSMDFSRYVVDWIDILISLLDDRQMDVVRSAWGALHAVTSSVKREELERLVVPVRKAVKNTGIAGVDLPGFCLPKGISPILPIFSQGLMYGTAEIREQAALGIGDLIQRTAAEALRPFVTQITGPLIRIIGERYPPQVKAAILQTLSLLLTKVPTHLKPFLPQLQRTFIKSLTDPSSAQVRIRAASALGILISLQTRVDPLVAELVSGIKSSEPNVKETMLSALASVLNKAGGGMSEVSKKGVIGVVSTGLNDTAEGMIIGAAKVLGNLCKHISPEETRSIITSYVLTPGAPPLGSLYAINAILVETPQMFQQLGLTEEVIDTLTNNSASSQPNIADNAILATGKMLLTEMYHEQNIIKQLLIILTNNIREPATSVVETRRLALVVLSTVGKKYPEILETNLSIFVPSVVACARDRNLPIKLAAERALVFTLQLISGESVMQRYLSSADQQTSRAFTEVHRRALMKVINQEEQRREQLRIEGAATDAEDEEEASCVWRVGDINRDLSVDDE